MADDMLKPTDAEREQELTDRICRALGGFTYNQALRVLALPGKPDPSAN